MIRVAFVVIWVALLAGGAQAKRPDAQANEEARQHYQRGMTHYDLAEYDAAVGEFKQAYALSNEPGLLFNIAQTYRLKRDWEQAQRFYESYLGLVPDAPNRADVEAQLAKVKQSLQEESAQREHPKKVEPRLVAPPVPPAATVVTAPASSPPAEPPRPRFLATAQGRAAVATAAIGAAALVTAAITGGLALSTRSSYDHGCDAGACDGGLYDSGRRLAIATDVLIGVGAAAAVTAVVLAVARPRARPVRLGWAF